MVHIRHVNVTELHHLSCVITQCALMALWCSRHMCLPRHGINSLNGPLAIPTDSLNDGPGITEGIMIGNITHVCSDWGLISIAASSTDGGLIPAAAVQGVDCTGGFRKFFSGPA